MNTVKKSANPMNFPPGMPTWMKAPAGPCRVIRPKVHSAITAGIPRVTPKKI